jgi:HEAT repeat protein
VAIPKDELDRLLVAMQNVDNVRRAVRASEELSRQATVEDVPLLRRLLAAGDYFVREALSTRLAELEGPSALPLLLQLLREGQGHGHDHDGLAHAVIEVVTLHQAEVAPVLAQMSQSPEVQARRDAAWLLGFVSSVAPIEPLFRLARDPEPRVRGNAIGALGSYKGRDDVYQALAAALSDPEESVRIDAASALGYYGDRRAIPLLEPLASRRATADVRRIALYALKCLRESI